MGALYFHHQHQRALAEEQAQQEFEQKFQESANQFKESASDFAEVFAACFVSGMKHPYDDPYINALRGHRVVLDHKLLKEPDSVELRKKRVALNFELGDHYGALDDLNEILFAEPDFKLGRYQRACLFSEFGNREGAIQDLDYLLEHDPFYPWALNNRACYKAELGDFEGALADARKAVERQSEVASCHDTLGYVLVGLGHYQEAIEVYDQTLQLDPEQAHSLWGRAVCYHRLGESERAQADLERLAEVAPGFCLHWALEDDPGSHEDGDKLTLR